MNNNRNKLPNFIIVGAAKSGTTSVDRYLRQHPDVYMCPQKEPYFFSFINKNIDFKGPYDDAMKNIIVTDFEKYKSFFDNVTHQKAIGECSNSYLFFPHTAAEIKKYIPDCKIIIILRDPVERAFSHYAQHVMLGHEHLSFEEAIEREEERKKAGWRWHYQYLAQSKYYEQVKRYYELFPKENILVLLFDDLKNDPKNFLIKLLKFIDVNPSVDGIEFKIYNKTGMPKNRAVYNFLYKKNNFRKTVGLFIPKSVKISIFKLIQNLNIDYNAKPKIAEETRIQLKKYFKPDIEKLEKLLQKDLSNWY